MPFYRCLNGPVSVERELELWILKQSTISHLLLEILLNDKPFFAKIDKVSKNAPEAVEDKEF